MKNKAGKTGVLSLLLAAVVLGGCAAGVDEGGEGMMEYRSTGPAIDSITHDKVETATFAMG